MTDKNRLPFLGLAAAAAGLLVESAAWASTRRPAEADRSAVSACRALGEVRGDSGFGKHAGTTWTTVARRDALARAGRLGATHVVWEGSSGRGAFNGRVDASAWVCH